MMEQFLKQNGWVVFSACSCGGSLKRSYRYALYPYWEITVTPANGSYVIRERNSQRAAGKGLDSLTQKMIEHEIFQKPVPQEGPLSAGK